MFTDRERLQRAAAGDAWVKRREAARRGLSTRFKVWRRCPDKSCKRAQACRGNDTRCLGEFLRSLHPDARLYLQKLLEARKAGLVGDATIRATSAAFLEACERQQA